MMMVMVMTVVVMMVVVMMVVVMMYSHVPIVKLLSYIPEQSTSPNTLYCPIFPLFPPF